MASVILIQAWPRNASTGAEVALRFAGGGSRAYSQLGFLDWRAGVVAMPRYSSAIAFEQVGFTGGAIPTTGAIAFNSSDQTLSSTVGNYLWTDARVEITVGDDETGVYATAAKGKVAGASCDGGVLSITFADMSGDLTKMVVPDTFAGTGGVEGPTEATGRIKRRSWGRVFDIEARLINVAQNIYEVGDPSKPLQQIEIVRDKGRNGPLSVLAWQGSITATYDALVAASVPAGGAVVAPSIAMLKWWTVPSGPLTADLRGEVGAGYVETVATIANRLVGTFSTAITVGNLAEASGWSSAPAGIHAADQTESVGKLLDRLLAPMLWAWTISPAAVLTFSRLSFSAPVEALSAITISRNGTFAPLKQRIVGYKKNHRVHGDGEISSALLASDVIYEDGQTAQDLQPAEAGATNGASAAEKSQLAQLEIDTANAQANIADAQAQIAAIEGSVSADFSAVNAEVDALQGSLSTAQTNIGALQSGQSTLNTQVGNLQTQATSIAASVSGLNTQVGTINTNVSALTTRIADAEGDIDSLQSTVASQGAAITANATAITNAQGALAEYSIRLSSNSRNLLPNGGPEALLRGWTGSALWTVNGNNSEGAYFLCTPTSVSTFTLTSDAIPMEANVALTLGYETRNTGATAYCDIFCFDSTGAQLLDGGQNAGPAGTTWGDRAARAFTITTPANTASVRVRLVCTATSTSDRARIRQIKLEKGTAWSAYSNDASVAQAFTAISSAEANVASLQTTVATQGASITSNATAITALTGRTATLETTVSTQGASITSLQTTTSTTSANLATLTTRVNAASTNLLKYGGFESGATGWVIVGAASWGAVNGFWGPFVNTAGLSNGNAGLQSEQFDASPGQAWTASVDAEFLATAGEMYLQMAFLVSGNWMTVGTVYKTRGAGFTSTSDGRLRTTQTAPANTTKVRIQMGVVNVAGVTNCGFRQAKLEVGSVMSPYSNEASVYQTIQTLTTATGSLATLSTTVSTQGSSITSLQSSYTSLSGSLASLTTRVGTAESSITSLQSASTTQAGQISTLQSTVATQGSSISSNATAITTLQGNVASLTTRVNAAQTNLLVNGGLENGFAGAISDGGFTYGNWGTWGPNAWTSANGQHVFQFGDITQVQVGATYWISCDPLALGGSDICCDLLFLDASGNVLLDGGQNVQSGPFNYSTDDTRRGLIAVSAVAPSGTTRIRARIIGNVVSGATIGFRRVKVEMGASWTGFSSEASIVQTFTAYSGLDSSLATLSSTVSTQGGSITSLQSSFTSLNGTVSSLSSTVSAQGTSISTLQTTTATLQGNVATLTTRVSASGANILPNGGLENGFNSGISSAGGFQFSASNDWGPIALSYDNGLRIFIFAPVYNPQVGGAYTFSVDPLQFGTSDVYCDIICQDVNGNVLLDGVEHGISGQFNFDNTDTRRGQMACTVSSVPSGTDRLICRVFGTVRDGQPIGFRRAKLENGTVWSRYSAEATAAQQFQTLSTLTTQYASLSSTVATQGVTISSQATAITTIQGNVTTLFGRAALTLNVNGAISGYEINNNGTVSNFKILASQFQVVDPDGNGSVPFEVSGGVTRIKAAAIGDATIDTLKIANGAITSLSYNSGITTVTTGYTDVATVTVTPVAGSSVLKIEIAGVFQTGLGSTGGTQAGYIRVTRSDSTIDVIAEFRPVTGSGMAANFSYFAIITGVTSAITFKLQGKNALVTPAPPTGEPSTVRGTLAVTEYKK